MALQKIVRISSHRQVKGKYFVLSFDSRALSKEAIPGQFIHVRISNGLEPLLRRPFGIHGVSGDRVDIIYEVVGKGTEMLSRKKAGEPLDVLGPLGNGFKLNPKKDAAMQILVAGGMGVAPLAFLAKRLAKSKTLVLIGAKTKNHIICEKEFKVLGAQVKIATDDGSRGFKGYISELLRKVLLNTGCRPSTIYACGPKPMLKEIKNICLARNIPGQASFEENIACGLGACLGCAISTKSGFKRVCCDGPVFDVKEVLF
jgi:dihydroorotate dehydrogenase electron transfer subunit